MPSRTGRLYDEESALLREGSTNPVRRSSGTTRTRAERGVSFNRVLIYLLVIALVLTNTRSRRQINDVNAQLELSRQHIQEISSTLEVHDEVIHRFNSSITNSDVIARMSSLEQTINETAIQLYNQLDFTKQEVSKQLNNTIKELSDTVTLAEKEISDEVEKVKKDVEHYVVTTQDQFSMENSFMVYQLAGTFTLLSCLISMWHMTAHLRKLNQPDVQRKILAILWMSPVYAVTSWFSLVFHSAEGYLAIIKDGYEAYIIYQFLSFCISVIGRGDRNVAVDVLARHAEHLTPPFRLFACFEMCGWCKPKPYSSNRALADAILLQCQGFAMQFVLFRPLTTTAMVVLKKLQYYGNGDGPADYRSPQFYLIIIQNLSIFVAFTGLLKFYHAVDKELAWCRPLAKFLCIKGVVFMTFWQGLSISVLAQTTDVAGKDKEEWATSAQNFLICLEMLLFSIAHFHCFPTEEWQEGYRLKAERSAFGDTIALGDFFQDVKLILTSSTNAGNDQHSSRRRRKKLAVATNSSRSMSMESTGSHSRSLRKVKSQKKESFKLSGAASKDTAEATKASHETSFYDVEQPPVSVASLSTMKSLITEPPKIDARDSEQLLEVGKELFKEEKVNEVAPAFSPMKDTHHRTTKLGTEYDINTFDRPEGVRPETGQAEHVIDKSTYDEEEESEESFQSADEDSDIGFHTDTTLEGLNDDQVFVMKALKKSLGSAGDDPDIMEATKRLLESKVLSPEFFLGNDASIEFPASFNSAMDTYDDDGVGGDDDGQSTGEGEEEYEDESDSIEEDYDYKSDEGGRDRTEETQGFKDENDGVENENDAERQDNEEGGGAALKAENFEGAAQAEDEVKTPTKSESHDVNAFHEVQHEVAASPQSGYDDPMPVISSNDLASSEREAYPDIAGHSVALFQGTVFADEQEATTATKPLERHNRDALHGVEHNEAVSPHSGYDSPITGIAYNGLSSNETEAIGDITAPPTSTLILGISGSTIPEAMTDDEFRQICDLNHQSKTANEADVQPGISPEISVPKKDKQAPRTPPRAYQQKGLEFLAPDRKSVNDKLRPSFFTTVAQFGSSPTLNDNDDDGAE